MQNSGEEPTRQSDNKIAVPERRKPATGWFGVVWLGSMFGVTALKVWADGHLSIEFIEAAGFESFIGDLVFAFFCAFVLILLSGLVAAALAERIAGAGEKPCRIGFTVATINLLVGYVPYSVRQHRQYESEEADFHTALWEVALGNAADELWGDEYQPQIQDIYSDWPSSLDTIDKINVSKSKLAQLSNLFDTRAERVTGNLLWIINHAGDAPKEMKDSELRSYVAKANDALAVFRQIADLENQYVAEVTSRTYFMQARLGEFHISGATLPADAETETVHFDDHADVAPFNAFASRVQKIGDQEQEQDQQLRQLIQQLRVQLKPFVRP
jgi:hypothetical protein